MARKLTRVTTRRIPGSDMVVSVRPEGLALRRHRKRKEVLVMWEELFKQYLPASQAFAVFATGAPSRWLPRPGEVVWAKAPDWDCAWKATVVKVLRGCGEEVVRVKFRRRERDLLLSQTRPCV